MRWFKKKTREEQIELRSEHVFNELKGKVDFEFTELETIQILNNVRRKLHESLLNKKSYYMEQSVINSQKSTEIGSVIKYIE